MQNPFIENPLLYLRIKVLAAGYGAIKQVSPEEAEKEILKLVHKGEADMEHLGIEFIEWLSVGLQQLKKTSPQTYKVIQEKGSEIIRSM